jgi:hypothetical protein
MSVLINTTIGQQNFELVLDRIGEILTDELAYQETYNTDLQVKVFKERDIPFNNGEEPMVNVMMERVDYEMQTVIQHDGLHRYVIEATRQGKGDATRGGDTVAMTKVQRLAGVIRAILMNPKYKTLGFTPGFIKNRHIQSIEFGKPIRQDSAHTVMARIVLAVSFVELTELSIPTVMVGYWTGVTIEETDKGYLFIAYN